MVNISVDKEQRTVLNVHGYNPEELNEIAKVLRKKLDSNGKTTWVKRQFGAIELIFFLEA
jgi:hypothetical protein